MNSKNLLLKNCRIFNRPDLICDILIIDGKIRKIGKLDDPVNNILDVKGHLVIPGVIDPHVHFRDPGLSHKGDWESESMAAVAGGITTVLSMPNTIPPVTTNKILAEKRKCAEKSIVNYGFHFGSSCLNNICEIKKAENIASTKVFLNSSTGNLKIEDKALIEKIFLNSKMITVHAEDDKIDIALNFANISKKKTYFCHLSSAKDLCRITKTDNIFIEVTPHHLFLNGNENNPLFKMYPSLKSKNDNSSLIEAINSGFIDCIGSDHAPHLIKEKKYKDPPAGIPGVQTLLPLMLNAFNNGLITLETIVKLTAENPSKIFGIKNKGKLAIGYDADITICNIGLEKTIKNNDMFYKCKWTPFDGMKLKGFPIITIVNGNIVFNRGKFNKIPAREVIFEDV